MKTIAARLPALAADVAGRAHLPQDKAARPMPSPRRPWRPRRGDSLGDGGHRLDAARFGWPRGWRIDVAP